MIKMSINSVYRKAEAIANELRSDIVSGKYKPGDRLPSRNKIMAEYDVSSATIQNALNQLNREGFVIAKDRSGTFVAERTPHLTHYALLFPQLKEMADHHHFNCALAKAAGSFNTKFKLDLHYGFEGARGFQRYQQLAEDVKKRRIAGLLFASGPYVLVNTPLLDVPGIPRSAFMSPIASIDIPSVHTEPDSFLNKMTEFVLEKKCQRVAVIASSLQAAKIIPTIQKNFQKEGIAVNPNWFQGSDFKEPFCTKRLTNLIMSGSADNKPDCLLVTDDNLLPPVSEALKDKGIIPPRDIQLLAHCNFPSLTESAVPAVRLGYSMTECIQAMMQQIEDQQNLRTPQMHIKIPAYFEEEMLSVSP